MCVSVEPFTSYQGKRVKYKRCIQVSSSTHRIPFKHEYANIKLTFIYDTCLNFIVLTMNIKKEEWWLSVSEIEH